MTEEKCFLKKLIRKFRSVTSLRETSQMGRAASKQLFLVWKFSELSEKLI